MYVLTNIVRNMVYESASILLIGGDISANPIFYSLFVKLLREEIDKRKFTTIEVFFVLGNHELWAYPSNSIDEIVEKYRLMIENNGMHLIHNSLAFINGKNQLGVISQEELCSLKTEEIRKQILSTRFVLFGGIGFAKYNEKFNANQLIYRLTLDRSQEIIESEKFENLYNKIIPIIADKNALILTHFPKKDWSGNEEPFSGTVYVSGHSHRNEFYDDGVFRIYYDNQIGYHNENVHLKNLLMDASYDCFSDYVDGIYRISGEQYNDFYRGKNIQMNFTRKVNTLYMLKKHGFYCFIHESTSFSLSILNGGALKKLERKDIRYYYEHMDEVIDFIQQPLTKYTDFQRRIAKEIQKIGGSGKIHGCIIDIDWFNHIYVNPVDSSITPYFALDIINKTVYKDVISLLKDSCPSLYTNYKKMLKTKKDGLLLLGENNNKELQVLPQEYLSTDIYKASREIKKMQRLNDNILSTWIENPVEIGHKSIEKT